MTQPDPVSIRVAHPADAQALLRLYAPYVTHTAITFEYEVPTLSDFTTRIATTLQKYPYLVAERSGEILGYAYTSPFAARAAYGWAAGTSIYVAQGMHRQGLGSMLYTALEAVSKAQNLLNLNACIAFPETSDAFLTQDSARFHTRMGYRLVGEFHQCGYKFGRWYNIVWMEKHLGEHVPEPAPVIPFPELTPKALQAIGIHT